MEVFFHVGSGHLSTIIKMGTNTIKVMVSDFVNSIFMGRGVGGKQLCKRWNRCENSGGSSSIQESCEARVRGNLMWSSFAGVAREVKNIFIANVE